MIINNNLTALSALNATKAANDMVTKSIKPLASGLKINSASDDASGLAISEKMRSQIKGYDMAIKNAQDGISMLRVAEGALGDTNDLLHRMRELSVQAGNDTLTMQDRTHIQEEIEELRNQLDNVSRFTNFNTKRLLNGDSGAFWSTDDINVKVRVHGGLLIVNDDGNNRTTDNAGINYRIEVRSDPGKAQVKKSNIMSVTETMFIESDDDNEPPIEVYYDKALSEISQFYDTEGKFIVTEPQKLTIVQGNGKTADVMLYHEDTLRDTAAKINDAIAFGLGQSVYTDDAGQFAVLSDGSEMTSESVYSRSALYDDDGKITGYDIKSTLVVRSAVQGREGEIYFAGNDELIRAFGLNTIQDSQEGTFNISVFDAHTGEVVASDIKVTGHELGGIIHPNVDVDFDPMAGTVASWNENKKEYILASSGTYTANVHLANNGILFQTGTNQDESFAVQLGNVSAGTLGVDRVSVLTRELAERSLGYIDEAIDSVVKQRTQIVSYGNALEHTLLSITVAGENLNDSRARITDADYAQSTMRFIEFQILSKAENAMLAQANQQPEAVFSLLGNSQSSM
ncbi:MAG: hypothetical protein IJF90_05295 [Synergistaceae bacterium]|nr:hypothetical protein [Synergistaceae bacterium]MBR0184594.1 hypothetical protein [Synergistaceae bacterium]